MVKPVGHGTAKSVEEASICVDPLKPSSEGGRVPVPGATFRLNFTIARKKIPLLTRAIVQDRPLGVSLYVEVFSFATRLFKFLS